MRGKDICFVVQFEVHTRIVDQCRLVDIDIQTIVGAQLQRGLHTRRRECADIRSTHIAANLGHTLTNFAHLARSILVLLCSVATRNPICHVVARHCELGVLLFDDEIGEFLGLLRRELVAKSQTVIIESETDIQQEAALFTTQLNEQLVVVVANLATLTPYRLTSLIEGNKTWRKKLHCRNS